MTVEEAVRKVAEMGFDGVELTIWDVDSFDEARRKSIREEVESLGIEVWSVGCNDSVYVWNAPVYTNPEGAIRDEIVRRIGRAIETGLEWNCELIGL
jgi:sugar phosphate isomerase/epimerase